MEPRGRTNRLFSLALAGAALTHAACSVMVEPNRQQCAVDADCKARGGEFANSLCVDSVCAPDPDPAWSCLKSVSWPPPTASQVTVTVKFRDIITNAPLTAVSVNVCLKFDYDCTQPIQKDLHPPGSGDLAFKVDAGFDGFLEMNMTGSLPGLFFFYPPVNEDRVIVGLPLLPAGILSQVSALSGKPYIAEKGAALLGAMDCRNLPAQGVHIWSTDADSDTTAFYVVKKIPSTSAMVTDESGEGGLINLKPGSVVLSGNLQDGRSVGSVTVVVRPMGITYTSLVPSPN
jgi:hypothetical protein